MSPDPWVVGGTIAGTVGAVAGIVGAVAAVVAARRATAARNDTREIRRFFGIQAIGQGSSNVQALGPANVQQSGNLQGLANIQGPGNVQTNVTIVLPSGAQAPVVTSTGAVPPVVPPATPPAAHGP